MRSRITLVAALLFISDSLFAAPNDTNYGHVSIRARSEHPSCNYNGDGGVEFKNTDTVYWFRIHVQLYADNGCKSHCTGANCNWSECPSSCYAGQSCSQSDYCKGCNTHVTVTQGGQPVSIDCNDSGEFTYDLAPNTTSPLHFTTTGITFPPDSGGEDCDQPAGRLCSEVWLDLAEITHWRASANDPWTALATTKLLCLNEVTSASDCWLYPSPGGLYPEDDPVCCTSTPPSGYSGCTTGQCLWGPWCTYDPRARCTHRP